MRQTNAQRRQLNSIITSFIEAKHDLDNKMSEKRLGHIKDEKLSRRQKRNENLANQKKAKNKGKKAESKSAMNSEKFRSMDEHKIKLDELYTRLKVDPDKGLSDKDVETKRIQYGLNVLTEKGKTPWYVHLADEFTNFFALMLFVGAGMSLFLYGISTSDPSTLYLCIALLVVVLLTSTTTFLQNQKSEAVMDGFKNFIPPKSRCLRNGSWSEINANLLVPGDIVEIISGKRIPADMRIISSQEMKVDNSSLTGESDALLRSPECTHPEHPLETMNLAFFGTLCKEGSGRGIVVMTGDDTVIGQIANLAGNGTAETSPLVKEINNFVMKMSLIAFFFGCAFFVLGFVLGFSAVTSLIFAIGIIVANMPEGIIATLTVCITLAAQRLAVAKVLVKNLGSVETLGCTTVICSDKTGTLTQNRMTAANLWYGNSTKRADNTQKCGPNHQYQYDTRSRGFIDLHESAILGSDTIFDNTVPQEKIQEADEITNPAEKAKKQEQIRKRYQDELSKKLYLDRPCIGDASESALVKFYQPIEDILITRSRYPTLKMDDASDAKMPFNSTNKFALNIVKYETNDSHHCIFMKGAPEKIWKLCSHILIEGELQEIDDKWNKEFDDVNIEFGKKGERVLGFAKYHLPKSQFSERYQYNCKAVEHFNFPMNKFAFCGLVSLIDPPREIVPFSVIKCKTAGIKVIMVTGDQPVTAAAIARQVNIFDKDVETVNEVAERKGISIQAAMEFSDAIVIHGDLITEAMKEDETLPESERGKRLSSWLAKPQVVFARTSPAQKLIIVQGCQKLGHVVAVTGDGVNDSPAIKKADIGVAMGITGSDVAKDAADLVLLTDDFSAIVVGVEEGRKIYDNLKKCITYALTSNIPELIPYISMVIIGIPVPLSNILMLCINLGTDLFPAFSLAWEDGELDLMTRMPRPKNDHLFTARMITTAYFQMGALQVFGAFLAYFYIFNDFGFPPLSLVGMQSKNGLWPSDYDVYDPYRPDFGNSRVADMCNAGGPGDFSSSDNYQSVDWLYLLNGYHDLRSLFIECAGDGYVQETVTWGECRIKQLSSVMNLPVCYHSEALKYAQIGNFFAIVFCQITNLFACKTKKLSLYYHGIRNRMNFGGLCSEICLTFCLSCWIFIQKGFGSRDTIFFHYGLPGIPFSIMQLLLDEIRKYLIRKDDPSLNGKGGKPGWYFRNSYY